jgi:NTP pyrophosphatase (non-canonical NTP hydrolase)
MATLVSTAFNMSSEIDDDRTTSDILIHLMTEVGELAEEIEIHKGRSYKSAGADGVVGEAIDVIACALDIIHQHDSTITEDQLVAMIIPKLQKWKNNA